MPRRTRKQRRDAQHGPSRVVAYYRVSSEEQAISGLGLDAQRAKCQGMAAAKGWNLVNEYSDEGISGGKPPRRRPGLAGLLDDVRAGQVDAVIVAALDRLARDAEFTLTFERELRERGVALLSCRETFDTSTAVGKMFLTMLAAVGEFERNVGAERTKAALGQLGKTTGDKGGKVPYGYARAGENGDALVEVDGHAAPVVRRIFQHRADGWTLREIADALNADQVMTPRKGNRWHPSSVMDVLGNEDAYRGGRRADSPVNWPPILNSH